MTFKISVPAAVKARIHDCYHHQPRVTLVEMAREVGVTVKTFTAYRRAWGWKDRRQALFDALQAQVGAGSPRRRPRAVAKDARPAADPLQNDPHPDDANGGPDPSARAAIRDAATALARVAQARLRSLAADQRAGRIADPDKAARLLADYAKTLTTAQALLRRDDEVRDDEARDDEPRSLRDLHAELARHLERLVAPGPSGRGDGGLVEG
ncbi:hypothetical protein [Microvirga pudoricolor]|uniref:hypothetical protein n=1 Tax=Microvirga pudoricolor TaxID=2778729 RepID=UPI001E3C9158|nr:hypothetical protein [Microvirga pudoricolor]